MTSTDNSRAGGAHATSGPPEQRNLGAADEGARRQLNALRVTSNIVSALIRFPGPASNHDQAVAAARAMVQSAQRTTSGLIDDLGIGDEPWKQFRVMQLVSEVVAANWRSTASHGAPDASVEHMRPVWAALAEFDLPEDPGEQLVEDELIAIRIAVLEAMAPITREVGVASLFHDPGSAARHARDVILAACYDIRARLGGEQAGSSASLQLLTSLLRNAGAIYAAAWRRHGEAILTGLRGLPAEERAERIAAHPDGFPLNQIDAAFTEAFGRLADMVEHLAPISEPTPEVGPARARDRAPGETSSV
jgi:hypothetical protein